MGRAKGVFVDRLPEVVNLEGIGTEAHKAHVDERAWPEYVVRIYGEGPTREHARREIIKKSNQAEKLLRRFFLENYHLHIQKKSAKIVWLHVEGDEGQQTIGMVAEYSFGFIDEYKQEHPPVKIKRIGEEVKPTVRRIAGVVRRARKIAKQKQEPEESQMFEKPEYSPPSLPIQKEQELSVREARVQQLEKFYQDKKAILEELERRITERLERRLSRDINAKIERELREAIAKLKAEIHREARNLERERVGLPAFT